MGNSWFVKPEDLLSSEPSSDLETAVYHQKKIVNRSQTMIYTYQVSRLCHMKISIALCSNLTVSVFGNLMMKMSVYTHFWLCEPDIECMNLSVFSP